MTTQQHTPTPYVRSGRNIFDASGRCVVQTFYETPADIQNLDNIVRACNAHDALVAATEQARSFIDGGCYGHRVVDAQAIEIVTALTAVLKLARGES